MALKERLDTALAENTTLRSTYVIALTTIHSLIINHFIDITESPVVPW
jgi:hypothetical protein